MTKLRWCPVVLCLLMIALPLRAENWRKVVEADHPGASFNDAAWVGASHGWVVGSAGKLLQTKNGGVSGFDMVIDSLATLQSVFFRDTSNGFIGANKRTLFKTTNGGLSWTKATITAIPDTDAVIRTIYFADASRGWILSSRSTTNGRILHTTDGGTSWVLDHTVADNLGDMDFAKANVGVAVGKNIKQLYYTVDGVNWKRSDTTLVLSGASYSRSDIRSVDMVDSLTVYAVGWGSTVGAQPSIHLKSTDGGATWAQQLPAAPNRTYDNLWGVWFKDKNTGIAGGAGSIVTRTSDGGATWTPVTFPCGATINNIVGTPFAVWAVCGDGTFYHTADFGDTWTQDVEIPSSTLYSMQWVNSTTAFATGFDGIFLKTTNSGNDWTGAFISANRLSQNANDLHFTGATTGYAAHSYRMVTKTTNAGLTWTAVIPETTAATVTSYGVTFVDANLGFVVGQLSSSEGVVYKTTDAGATWAITRNAATKSLRDVGFGSATAGAAVGSTRTAIFTTNGGSSWATATFSGFPANRASITIYGVRFVSATTAVAVGDSTIMKSTDGGASWNYVATTSKTTLYGVDFKDATTGYAAGTGEVWKTTNGGDSWTNVIDAAVVSGTLRCIAVDRSGNPWVGTSNSRVFAATSSTGVEDADAAARSFRLDQNYPNPFNPSTTVSYQVPANGRVRLAVYDLLGREVAVLLDELKAPGLYSAQFDAGTLASGTYIYRLQAGGLVLTRKMLMVR